MGTGLFSARVSSMSVADAAAVECSGGVARDDTVRREGAALLEKAVAIGRNADRPCRRGATCDSDATRRSGPCRREDTSLHDMAITRRRLMKDCIAGIARRYGEGIDFRGPLQKSCRLPLFILAVFVASFGVYRTIVSSSPFFTFFPVLRLGAFPQGDSTTT